MLFTSDSAADFDIWIVSSVVSKSFPLKPIISKIEDIEHPNKTRTTPTTSIQFLCPGRIDDSTVYWDINRNTTST